MHRECIRCTPRWRNSGPRRDRVFVVEDQNTPGFRGMSVVRVRLLFSFQNNGIDYPCALVEWLKKIGRGPDPDTGLWMVEPAVRRTRKRDHVMSVVHLDSIMRGAHLMPVYSRRFLPPGFRHTWSLDVFEAFFINKYIDDHTNEIAY